MADETPLTDEEREELRRLRAEKAARERAQHEAAQKAELERLRAEKAEAERDALDAQRRERAREYMEPDDDLKMPLGQKIVLLALAVIVALFVIRAAASSPTSIARVPAGHAGQHTKEGERNVAHGRNEAHGRLAQHGPVRAHDGPGILGERPHGRRGVLHGLLPRRTV